MLGIVLLWLRLFVSLMVRLRLVVLWVGCSVWLFVILLFCCGYFVVFAINLFG